MVINTHEKRAIDQTNSAIAPVSVGAYIDSLQASGLYDRVGVNNLGTVAADTVLPIAGGSTVGWQTEVGLAADGGADFDGVDDRSLNCFLEVGIVPGSLKTTIDQKDCQFLVAIIGQGNKKAIPYEP